MNVWQMTAESRRAFETLSPQVEPLLQSVSLRPPQRRQARFREWTGSSLSTGNRLVHSRNRAPRKDVARRDRRVVY